MYLFHKFLDWGSALLGSFRSARAARVGEERESVVDGSVAKKPTAGNWQKFVRSPTQPRLSPALQPRGNPQNITKAFWNTRL